MDLTHLNKWLTLSASCCSEYSNILFDFPQSYMFGPILLMLFTSNIVTIDSKYGIRLLTYTDHTHAHLLTGNSSIDPLTLYHCSECSPLCAAEFIKYMTPRYHITTTHRELHWIAYISKSAS